MRRCITNIIVCCVYCQILLHTGRVKIQDILGSGFLDDLLEVSTLTPPIRPIQDMYDITCL